MVPRVNVVEITITSRLRYFVRINPPMFLGSKVEEDPQECIDCLYKVLNKMGVTSMEKEELDSYQLREVSQV